MKLGQVSPQNLFCFEDFFFFITVYPTQSCISFRISLSLSKKKKKKWSWDFDNDCTECVDCLGDTAIMTIVSLPIQECEMPFHLIRSLTSSAMFYSI